VKHGMNWGCGKIRKRTKKKASPPVEEGGKTRALKSVDGRPRGLGPRSKFIC